MNEFYIIISYIQYQFLIFHFNLLIFLSIITLNNVC